MFMWSITDQSNDIKISIPNDDLTQNLEILYNTLAASVGPTPKCKYNGVRGRGDGWCIRLFAAPCVHTHQRTGIYQLDLFFCFFCQVINIRSSLLFWSYGILCCADVNAKVDSLLQSGTKFCRLYFKTEFVLRIFKN